MPFVAFTNSFRMWWPGTELHGIARRFRYRSRGYSSTQNPTFGAKPHEQGNETLPVASDHHGVRRPASQATWKDRAQRSSEDESVAGCVPSSQANTRKKTDTYCTRGRAASKSRLFVEGSLSEGDCWLHGSAVVFAICPQTQSQARRTCLAASTTKDKEVIPLTTGCMGEAIRQKVLQSLQTETDDHGGETTASQARKHTDPSALQYQQPRNTNLNCSAS
jgi:hypothetical protein